MPGAPRDGDLDASLSRARRIHHACERYEAEWTGGGRPRIETFLDACADDDRYALFRELLALELELRPERGEHPTSNEYLARFPDLDQAIHETFREMGPGTCESPPTLPWNSANQSDPTAASPGVPGAISGCGFVPPTEERLGDYVLLDEIARGGMGVVYRARQVSLDRIVALKMILSGTLATPEERARFRREAELAGKLDHANIVPIHEVREQDGVLFFSMKLIDGGSLAQERSAYLRNPLATARLLATLAAHFTTHTARAFSTATSNPRTS